MGDFVKSKMRVGFDNPLFGIAAEELHKIQIKKFLTTPPNSCVELLDKIAKNPITPEFAKLTSNMPLKAYANILDSIAKGQKNLRYCVHAPAQHGKTTLTLVGIIYTLLLNPGCFCMYVTFNSDKAGLAQAKFVRLLDSLGI